jgi:hypothetical protein
MKNMEKHIQARGNKLAGVGDIFNVFNEIVAHLK